MILNHTEAHLCFKTDFQVAYLQQSKFKHINDIIFSTFNKEKTSNKWSMHFVVASKLTEMGGFEWQADNFNFLELSLDVFLLCAILCREEYPVNLFF